MSAREVGGVTVVLAAHGPVAGRRYAIDVRVISVGTLIVWIRTVLQRAGAGLSSLDWDCCAPSPRIRVDMWRRS